MGFKVLACIYALMSAVTFVAYGIDKSRAVHQRRRIPELRLHLLELLGGWPGAFVAQTVFRHKRRKAHYMLTFAAIVALHGLSWGTWLYTRR